MDQVWGRWEQEVIQVWIELCFSSVPEHSANTAVMITVWELLFFTTINIDIKAYHIILSWVLIYDFSTHVKTHIVSGT